LGSVVFIMLFKAWVTKRLANSDFGRAQ